MSFKVPCNSDVVDNLRNMTISRRGGVRTRGGRLPPINIREISQVTGSNKKIIAPNIPQRRKVIKQEVKTLEPESVVKLEPGQERQNSRDRSRGRQSKIILQTQGTFLAEGPAARTKRDPLAYESFSFSRVSRSAASEDCAIKYDDETIKKLVEFDEESEECEGYYGEKLPNRFPFLKKRLHLIPKIKAEPDEDKEGVTKIKEEVMNFKEEVVKIKQEIKSESDDEDDEEFKSKTKMISIKKEADSKIKMESFLDEVKNIGDVRIQVKLFFKHGIQNPLLLGIISESGKLILFQVPTLASTSATEPSKETSEEIKAGTEIKSEQVSSLFDNLEEGFIGKLKFMKSGKMKMVLGTAELDLKEGSPLSSCMEVVSMSMTDNGGDLVVIGNVERKMILTPVVDSLIKKNEIPESNKC